MNSTLADTWSVAPVIDHMSECATAFSLSVTARKSVNTLEFESEEDTLEVLENSVLISKVKASLYECTHKLDQGGYSMIFLGKLRRAFGFLRAYEREFVIKCCEVTENERQDEEEYERDTQRRRRPKMSLYRQIEHEILLLKRAQSKHVVNLIEAFQLQKNANNLVYIVMEKLEVGLHHVVQGKEDVLNAEQIAAVVGDVLQGLKHIHAKGIVHRDIKCSNILLSKTGCAKICDFGLAGRLDAGQELYRDNYLYGTHGFIAPEMLISNMPYDYALDVWSLGITVLFLLRGQMPYASTDANADFSDVEWDIYKRSQEEYYAHVIGRDVINYAKSRRRREELREDRELSRDEKERLLQSSRDNRELFEFLKLALIPSPAKGWKNDKFDFTVTRQVRDRASVQELLETDFLLSDGISQELRKRNTILYILQETQRKRE